MSKQVWLVLGVLVLSAGIIMSCRQRERRSGSDTCDKIPALNDCSKNTVFINKPVPFCWQQAPQIRTGNVQILVDASGSMNGLKHTITPLVNWLQHGIKRIDGPTMSMQNFRLCLFNKQIGISRCITQFGQPMSQYFASADTNLHEAILSANDYELTLILTDGVAAMGATGRGSCTMGVDPACIAQSLQNALHPLGTAKEVADRGLWIIPILAIYDGLFFTETIAPANFNTAQTIQNVYTDFGLSQEDVIVHSPQNDSHGQLKFVYNGPRIMLLIVIARWSDMGRAAVQALWEQTALDGIQQVSQKKGFRSGIAVLSPIIEIYPGFLNPVQWEKLEEPQGPKEICGTMDVFFNPDPNKSSIRLDCTDTSGQEIRHLTGVSQSARQTGGCIQILNVPAFNFKLEPVAGDDSDLKSLLKVYECENAPEIGFLYNDLRLHLTCDMKDQTRLRTCETNPISLQWRAYANYQEAFNCLDSSDCSNIGPRWVRDLSTINPAMEPQRIFALSETIKEFYRIIQQDQRGKNLSNLEICHGKK